MQVRRVLMWIAALVALGMVAIQFVPVERTNPEGSVPLSAGAEVMDVLRESCYDCHSYETRWPWYSYVAPVSWLVANDVNEGRDHMNFSTWGNLPFSEREHLAEEIMEEVEEGAMPLPNYLRLHPSARLTEDDLAVLEAWTAEFAGDDHGREPGSPGEGEEDAAQHEDQEHGDEDTGHGDDGEDDYEGRGD